MSTDLVSTVIETDSFGMVNGTESLEDYQALDIEISDTQGKSVQLSKVTSKTMNLNNG